MTDTFVDLETLGLESIITSATSTELVLRVGLDTQVRITGSGFTYGGSSIFPGAPFGNHLPTGGTISTVVFEVLNPGFAAVSLWTLSNVQVGLGAIGTLLSGPAALKSQISWLNLLDISENAGPVIFTETLVRLPNIDGTFTEIVGTGLGQNGELLIGTASAIRQVAANGTTVLNSIATTLSLEGVAIALDDYNATTAIYRLLQTGANTLTASGPVSFGGDNYFFDLIDGPGNDTIIGNGSAPIDYFLATSGVTVDLNAGTATGGGGSDTLTNIGSVLGSFFDDTLIGNGSNNFLYGYDGNDVITPGAGNDFVSGERGDDVVVLSGTQGTESLFGDDGFDTLRIGGSSQVNLANSSLFDFEAVSFEGAAAGASIAFNFFHLQSGGLPSTLQIRGNENPNAVVFFAPSGGGAYSLAGTNFSFLTWEEGGTQRDSIQLVAPSNQIATYTLTGSSRRDVIVGSNGNDVLFGGAGNDTLTGGAGNDTVNAEAGDDLIVWSGFRPESGQTSSNQMSFAGDIVGGGDGLDDIIFQNSFNFLGSNGTNTAAPTNVSGVERLTFAASNTAAATVAAYDSFFDMFGSNLTVRDSGNLGTVILPDNLEIHVADGAFTMAGWTFETWGAEDAVRVFGGVAHDVITGSSVRDVISGGAGNDTLTGGASNDTLDGGAGRDTAQYNSAFSAASLSRNALNWTVTAGVNGTDSVTGVEFLQFTDRTVALDRAFRTFAGDATSDILFRNVNGLVAAWNVTGTTISSAGFLPTAPSEFAFLGTGDLGGDGKDDVVWIRNDGLVYTWTMNGLALSGGGGLTGIGTGVWTFLGAGDFNLDLTDDIAWRSNTGSIAIWTMNNNGIQSASFVPAGLGAEWQFGGLGDFNGDGKDDFVWKNSNTAQTFVWLMNGATITSAGATSIQPGAGWNIVGIGDTNGDGRDDILVRQDGTGQIRVLAMDGLTVLSATDIGPTISAAEWAIEGVGDYNGDGKDDILFRNIPSGVVYQWLLDGATIIGAGGIAGVGAEWEII